MKFVYGRISSKSVPGLQCASGLPTIYMYESTNSTKLRNCEYVYSAGRKNNKLKNLPMRQVFLNIFLLSFRYFYYLSNFRYGFSPAIRAEIHVYPASMLKSVKRLLSVRAQG